MGKIKFIDLFCGIGGFRFAAEELGWQCMFSSDINEECRKAYKWNFGEEPFGDITKINEKEIPDHDVLLGGFPCQPFSICGDQRGFEDTRGTLFFDIARIIKEKKPKSFVLENVKMLRGHNHGKTIARIEEVLRKLEYEVFINVLNALDFGLPQKRERIFIVGSKEKFFDFKFPSGEGAKRKSLSEILEKNIPKKFFASDSIQANRKRLHPNPHPSPSIWHENKGGHISSYPFSCALRAGASYNYLLVDGVRRLTPREMLRLQGFPEEFEIVCNDSQTRKQAGNAVPVPMVKAVLDEVYRALLLSDILLKKEYYGRPETKDCFKSKTAVPVESISI